MSLPLWLLWLFRGKRLVRLHMVEIEKEIAPFATMEGILLGRRHGHYILLKPGLVQAEDRVVPIDGTAEVPVERVLFVQVLRS